MLDLGFWTYTTVVGRASRPFEPVIADRESLELSWVPLADVDDLPLHPGFGAAWPALRDRITTTPHVVVDAANVVGSVPDGWWKDRSGAAERLLGSVGALAAAGLPAGSSTCPSTGGGRGGRSCSRARRVPRRPTGTRARARPPRPGSTSCGPRGSGDDAIVAAARTAVDAGDAPVLVVTADRELRARVEAVGAGVRGPGWIRDRLG